VYASGSRPEAGRRACGEEDPGKEYSPRGHVV
jgi:hypothetical protein